MRIIVSLSVCFNSSQSRKKLATSAPAREKRGRSATLRAAPLDFPFVFDSATAPEGVDYSWSFLVPGKRLLFEQFQGCVKFLGRHPKAIHELTDIVPLLRVLLRVLDVAT
jgi:hypothetical protein